MLRKKLYLKVIDNFACESCVNEKSNQALLNFTWKDLKIKPVGYKYNYKYYVKCPRCASNVIIPERFIPITVKRNLIRNIECVK